jgi:hypothetical protein
MGLPWRRVCRHCLKDAQPPQPLLVPCRYSALDHADKNLDPGYSKRTLPSARVLSSIAGDHNGFRHICFVKLNTALINISNLSVFLA